MAELTATTTPSVGVWMVNSTSSATRYSVRIGIGPTAHCAMEQGHWVVVLDDADKVSGVGRILRIRSSGRGPRR